MPRADRPGGGPAITRCTSTPRSAWGATPRRSSTAHPTVRLIGLDRDPQALALSGERLAPFGDRVRLEHAVYDELPEVLTRLSLDTVDSVLFDLGVSSMQLDDAGRGFAYAQDAPLDMRMDPTTGITAAEVVNSYPARDLARVLRVYGEERFASRIAQAIVRERTRAPLNSSARLAELVRDSIPAPARRTGGHPAKRTFQALRIEVNGELAALDAALPEAIDALVSGRPNRCHVVPLARGPDRQAGVCRARPVHGPGRPAGRAARKRPDPAAAHPGRRAAHRGRGRGEPAGRVGEAARR